MSNIIDSIRLSGTVYTLSAQTGGGGVPESAFTAYTASTNERISQDEEVTAAALNELNESLSGKQDTLSAGTNITISGNVISAEGGGKAIEAGRGISITTGATADTVSFSLPISAGTGINSLILNYSGNTANGKYSVAEGSGTTANNFYSHAEGYGTRAEGTFSHAEGRVTNASGYASHAEGEETIASGIDSHAEGYGTRAGGNMSHAEGFQTEANGNASHAEGSSTRANNKSEHASGQYNVSSKASTTFGGSGNTLFSVGNGTADNARHNAFEIRQNGDIYLTSGGTDIKLQDHLGGGGTVDQTIISGSTNAVAGGAVYDKIDEVEEVTAAGLNALNDKITPTVELTQAEYDALVSAGTVSADTYYIITDATAFDPSTKVDTSAFTAYSAATNTALNNKVDKSAVVSSVTSASTDSVIPTAKAVYDAIQSGGTSFDLPIYSGTAEGALKYNYSGNTSSRYYSHAEGFNTSATSDNSHAEGYQTKASGKQSHAEGRSTTASGNQSHAEGQGTTAGGDGSHAEGYYTKVYGDYNHAEGYYTVASGRTGSYWQTSSHAEGCYTSALTDASHAEGKHTFTKNVSEHASGAYNVSSSASTTFGDSGNTLFSVGNGTSNNARHNAFEIRQNGDIYLSLNGQDVKLQDQLGGSSITVDTALDSGSTNPVENRVIYNKIDEVEQVTAAGLNAVNDKFDGLKLKKLTQVEYDALSGSTDANTLYVIVN